MRAFVCTIYAYTHVGDGRDQYYCQTAREKESERVRERERDGIRDRERDAHARKGRSDGARGKKWRERGSQQTNMT